MEHGEIRYIQMPTADIEVSAGFYGRLFGWTTRTRGDGSGAFDDSAGHVSGEWRPEVTYATSATRPAT